MVDDEQFRPIIPPGGWAWWRISPGRRRAPNRPNHNSSPNFIFQTTDHWLATARGRLGYAVDKWLFFLSSGGAWAGIESNQFVFGLPFNTGNLQNNTRTGWTYEAGSTTRPLPRR